MFTCFTHKSRMPPSSPRKGKHCKLIDRYSNVRRNSGKGWLCYSRRFSESSSESESNMPILSTEQCPICFENIDPSSTDTKKTACNHTFHYSCLERWVDMIPNCPICRTAILETDGLGNHTLIRHYYLLCKSLYLKIHLSEKLVSNLDVMFEKSDYMKGEFDVMSTLNTDLLIEMYNKVAVSINQNHPCIELFTGEEDNLIGTL